MRWVAELAGKGVNVIAYTRILTRTLAGLSGWVYSLSDCCPILSGVVVFVKSCFKFSSLFSLFLVGIKPGAVNLGV